MGSNFKLKLCWAWHSSAPAYYYDNFLTYIIDKIVGNEQSWTHDTKVKIHALYWLLANPVIKLCLKLKVFPGQWKLVLLDNFSLSSKLFMTEQSLGITHKNATFHSTNFVSYELVWVLWGYFMVFVTVQSKDIIKGVVVFTGYLDGWESLMEDEFQLREH